MAQGTNLGTAFVNIKVAVDGLGQIAALRSQVNGLNSLGGRIKSAFQASGQELLDLGQRVRLLSFTLRDAGRQMTLFGAAVAAGFVFVAKEGAAFEQGVANVVSVLNELNQGGAAAEAGIRKLEDTFIRLGEETKFTAVDIAGAAEQLALAGFSAQEIVDSLEGITDLAAAAGQTAEETALASTGILRAFGIQAADMNRVADTLTATFTNTNTTLTSLQESFKIVAPSAAAFGASLEEVSTALGLLGNVGLRGSLAGTGLSRLLTQLASDTENLNELLIPLGSSAEAVSPLQNSLSDIIAEFERLIVSGKLAEEQLTAVFDQRAARTLLSLVNQGSTAFDELNQKLEDSVGLTKRIAEIRVDTVAGAFERMTSALSSLRIELFRVVETPLRDFLETIQSIITGITNWAKNNQQLAKTIAFVAAVLGGLALIVGPLFLLAGTIAAITASFLILGSFLGVGLLPILGFVAAAIATVVAGLIAGKLAVDGIVAALRFFGLMRSTEEQTNQLKEAAYQLEALNEQALAYSQTVNEMITRQGKFNQLLANLGKLSPAQGEQLKKFISEGALTSPEEFARVKKDLEAQLAVLEKGKKEAEEAIEDNDNFNSEEGAKARAEADKRLATIQASIELLQNKQQRLLTKEEEVVRILAALRSSESQEKLLQEVQKEIENATVEVATLSSLETLDEATQKRLDEQKRILESATQLRTFLEGFTDETLDLAQDSFIGAEQAAIQAGRTLDAVDDGINAVNNTLQEFNQRQQKAIQDFAKLRKLAEESEKAMIEVFQEIDDRLLSDMDKKLLQLQDLRRKLQGSIADQIPFAVFTGDFQKASALVQELTTRLQQLNKLEREFFEEQDQNRDARIRGLQRENAESKKNTKEAVRLLREERREALKKELDELFTLPEGAEPEQLAALDQDRAAFLTQYTAETERLVKELKEKLKPEVEKVKKEEEKIVRHASERNEIEKAIASHLTNQVKSLEDAHEVSEFARAQQARHIREAQNAVREQVRIENNLLSSIEKRAKLERLGLDTTAIERRIRLQREQRALARDIAALAQGQIGIRGDREDHFKEEIKAAEKAAGRVAANADQGVQSIQALIESINMLTTVFGAAPATWVDALIQAWEANSPRFIEALLNSFSNIPTVPNGAPGFNPAGMAINPMFGNPGQIENFTDNRNITFNIEGVTDPEEVANIVRDRLFTNPPIAGGFLA